MMPTLDLIVELMGFVLVFCGASLVGFCLHMWIRGDFAHERVTVTDGLTPQETVHLRVTWIPPTYPLREAGSGERVVLLLQDGVGHDEPTGPFNVSRIQQTGVE